MVGAVVRHGDVRMLSNLAKPVGVAEVRRVGHQIVEILNDKLLRPQHRHIGNGSTVAYPQHNVQGARRQNRFILGSDFWLECFLDAIYGKRSYPSG